MLDLLILLYKKVGFKDPPNSPHTEQLKRTLIVGWTCKLGYRPCLLNSLVLFNEWMRTPSNNR